MVIPAIEARDVLHERLAVVFSKENYSKLSAMQAPKVTLGFPVNEPPFYVAVDEIIDTANTDGAASMGHAEVSFNLNVWVCVSHKNLKTAADTLLSYINTIFAAILADQQLNRTVDNAFPSIREAGTAADSSKRYIAAATVVIACKVSSVCPAEIKEVIDAINRS